MPKTIAFDADDTLWINEPYFRNTEKKIGELLLPYQSEEKTQKELYKTITGNIPLYGYGVKSCILSMLEYVSEVTLNTTPNHLYQEIIEMGKTMLKQPVELLPKVEETLKVLSKKHNLIVCTKGDLLDQQNKIKQSGLSSYFSHIEVMSDKTPETYKALLKKLNIAPNDFTMIGNSLKSDILPVLTLGAKAVYIPYHSIWQFETVSNNDLETYDYKTLTSIDLLIKELL